MKKRTVWIALALALLLTCLVLAALLDPHRRLRGFLAGEAFFRGKPTSYWGEVLRKHGQEGEIPLATSVKFQDGKRAFPVLRECARDPDEHVRWPAIGLIGESGVRTQEALDILVGALRDEHIEVRLKALSSLARWERMARPAVPGLVERLADREAQVAHLADLVLWEVDPTAAVKAGGWRPFTSKKHGFSVMVQSEPEREEKPFFGGGPGIVHSYSWWHRTGPHTSPARYIVAVPEFPPEAIAGKSDEERLDAQRDAALRGLGGKLVDSPISQHGAKGREQIIEVEGLGVFRSRVFLVGKQFYQVGVSYVPRFFSAKAADYFLDSFKLVAAPSTGVDEAAEQAIEKLGGTFTRDEEPGRPIVEVDLSDSGLKDEQVKELAGLKRLRKLNISANLKLTDAALKHLAGLKQLQSLDLSLTGVTNAGMQHLAGLEHLQTLSLPSTKVTGPGLRALGPLKELRELNLSPSGVTDADLEALVAFRQLARLHVYGTSVSDAGMQTLARMRHLRNLDLGYTKVTDKGLKELAKLKELRGLALGGLKLTDDSLKELAGLAQLQELNLEANQVTDGGLRTLAGLKNLRELHLSDTGVTDAGLKELSGLKELRRLDLARTAITDAGLKELSGLQHLEWLMLHKTAVTGVGVKHLPGLKELHIGGGAATDEGLKEVGRLTSLETLDLCFGRVTDAGLKELEGLKNLRKLYLTETKVTNAGLDALRKALPKVHISRLP